MNEAGGCDGAYSPKYQTFSDPAESQKIQETVPPCPTYSLTIRDAGVHRLICESTLFANGLPTSDQGPSH